MGSNSCVVVLRGPSWVALEQGDSLSHAFAAAEVMPPHTPRCFFWRLISGQDGTNPIVCATAWSGLWVAQSEASKRKLRFRHFGTNAEVRREGSST